MELPQPDLFTTWEAWAREFIRRLESRPLEHELARILVPDEQMLFAFDSKKGTIRLTAQTVVVDGDYGDVSVSGGGTVFTVDPALFAAPVHTHAAADVVSGVLSTARLGIGTADSTTVLFGDGTWDTISSGSALDVLDEGVSLDSLTGAIDFVGTGVTASTIPGGVQVSIPGGGAGVDVLDEGSTIGGTFATLDFVGAGVSVTNAGGGVAEVSIPGGAGGAVERVFTPPTLTDFTWVNQLTATAAQYSYGIVFGGPGVNGDSLHLLTKAAPATPYHVLMRFRINRPSRNYLGVGPIWRNSSSGALQCLAMGDGSSNSHVFNNFSAPGTFVALATGWTNIGVVHEDIWVRLSDDGTNRSISFSDNGETWWSAWNQVRTSYITPDQVGFFVNSNHAGSSTYGITATLLSWEEI